MSSSKHLYFNFKVNRLVKIVNFFLQNSCPARCYHICHFHSRNFNLSYFFCVLSLHSTIFYQDPSFSTSWYPPRIFLFEYLPKGLLNFTSTVGGFPVSPQHLVTRHLQFIWPVLMLPLHQWYLEQPPAKYLHSLSAADRITIIVFSQRSDTGSCIQYSIKAHKTILMYGSLSWHQWATEGEVMSRLQRTFITSE